MPKRPYSLKIKQRFIEAIDVIAKENYPAKKEVEILKKLGLTPSNYYRMKKSTANYPTLDNCALLCKTYHISETWLISGKGQMKDMSGASLSAVELLKEAVRMLEK